MSFASPTLRINLRCGVCWCWTVKTVNNHYHALFVKALLGVFLFRLRSHDTWNNHWWSRFIVLGRAALLLWNTRWHTRSLLGDSPQRYKHIFQGFIKIKSCHFRKEWFECHEQLAIYKNSDQRFQSGISKHSICSDRLNIHEPSMRCSLIP